MEIEYNLKIRPILDTYDEIGELLRNETIEIPKIVAVGDQSSGKSSVLESITGISLPRGTGTVTRCPIIIQSRSVKKEEDEFAEISIHDYEEYQNTKVPLNELSSKLSEYQAKLLELKELEITDIPITVKFYKRNAPDLSLYDLPGITYKKGLTDKVREMIKKYTAGKETIILLILAANVDLTNTEAIELIQQNSDFKERTLAVITKIDLGVHEKGLYKKIICNDLNLKYDPIVVRNRTQNEVEENEDIERIRHKEQELIETNEELRKLDKNSKGTKSLIKFLIEIQKEKLISCKFDIKDQINQKLKESMSTMKQLPQPAETFSDKVDRFKDCLNEFTEKFNEILEFGELNDNVNSKGFNNSRGLDKNMTFFIKKLFDTHKYDIGKKDAEFLSDEYFNKIQTMSEKQRGFKLPNFNDSLTLEKIMNEEINKIQSPSENLVFDISSYVCQNLLILSKECFYKYPILERMVSDEIKNLIASKEIVLNEFIKDLLTMEKTIKWTSDSSYICLLENLLMVIKQIKEGNNIIYSPPKAQNALFQPQISNINSNIFLSKQTQNEAVIPLTFGPSSENKKNLEIFNDNTYYSTRVFDYNVKIKVNSMLLTCSAEKYAVIGNIQISCIAYWRVFLKRFVDYLQIKIINEIIYFFRNQLNVYLDKKFSPSSSEQAQNWIVEDKGITTKRETVKRSIENLKKSLEKLHKIL